MDSLSLTKTFTTPIKSPIAPKWLETSVVKNQSLVPLSLAINDLESKYLYAQVIQNQERKN